MKNQDTKQPEINEVNDQHQPNQCDCGGECQCGEASCCNEKHQELVSQLAISTAEADEWKAKCMRALADYQNIERRSREEKNEVRLYASELILGKLLPVVDTFSKVKDHIKDIGFDLAFKELLSVLEQQGVKRMDVVGKEFNPHEMECIEVVDGAENIVIEESMPGYRFFEKVLQVARVKVGKKI